MQQIISSIEQLKFLDTNPQRLFHGRGRRYAALTFLNIDWLCPVLLITLYEQQSDDWENRLLATVIQSAPAAMQSIVVQRRYHKPAVFEVVFGPQVDRFAVSEQGLLYQLDFTVGLHSGLFLDMAEARQWVRAHAAGKRVLNLFSYTCAFSVAAMAGGADSVVNMDLSRPSLSRGRESHRLNNHDMTKVIFYGHDIFKSWSKLKRQGPFDLVVIDPPSYQKGSFVQTKDYPRVARQLTALLAEQGEVLACLNDPDQPPEYLQTLFAEYCPELQFRERLKNPAAFADIDEQKSLKVMHFKCCT